MKKVVLFSVLLLTSCASIFPTPNDFPPPPMTVIVEDFPTPIVTTTIEPRLALITQEKMQDARTFYWMLFTRVAAGDSAGIAEKVKYPITVNLDGSKTVANADEFELYYDQIFNKEIIDGLTKTSDEDLLLLPNGVRVGQSGIWFNLYCVDLACSDTQFFITQIDH
jgi:hypothetical protein